MPVGEILRKKLAFLQSRMTVQEQDPWFQTRVAQLESFSRQLQEMRGSLKSMGELKGRLEKATTEFQRGLVRTSLASMSLENQYIFQKNQLLTYTACCTSKNNCRCNCFGFLNHFCKFC